MGAQAYMCLLPKDSAPQNPAWGSARTRSCVLPWANVMPGGDQAHLQPRAGLLRCAFVGQLPPVTSTWESIPPCTAITLLRRATAAHFSPFCQAVGRGLDIWHLSLSLQQCPCSLGGQVAVPGGHRASSVTPPVGWRAHRGLPLWAHGVRGCRWPCERFSLLGECVR